MVTMSTTIPMNPCAPPPPPPPPSPNLSTTLSSLNNLLSLSSNTLTTLTLPSPSTNSLIQCPFNPHHLLPPNYLFLHHLRCPSSPRPITDPDLTHLLQTLTYPKTLQTPHSHPHSLSLHPFLPSNFFYDNCPGVVSFSPSNSLNRTLTLPSILSTECANPTGSHINDSLVSDTVVRSRILPSELCAIKRELESWYDFPASYSASILRAILGLGIAKERDQMMTWIIANSPRYGAVIDAPMQEHIFLLCCLCLKAILREAFAFASASASASSATEEKRNNSRLNCPVLKEALTWLQSQVSMLYGASGKFFVLGFVKNCVSVAASGILLFPLGGNVTAEACGSEKESEEINCILKMKICGSQVAAAVAALHERSLLEHRIRGVWFSQQPNKHQLVAEHGYLSERANEERKLRLDYRPVIDYDILHRQKLVKQEASREKTREELLAEARDHKRHTKSYRGKKKKSSALQVMRDMIEEYMEEIKLVAGVEDPMKVSEENGMIPSKPPSGHNVPAEPNNSRKANYDSPAVTITNSSYNEQQSRANKYCDKTKVGDDISRDYEQHRRGHYRSRDSVEDQGNIGQGKYHRDRAYTSPERHRSHSRSHEHSIHHKKRDYSDRKNYDHLSRTRDRRQKDTDRNHISDSSLKNAFSDRYDPSESFDVCEDDVSSHAKYTKPNIL